MEATSKPTETGTPQKWDSRKRVFFTTTVMIAMVTISYCLVMFMPEAQSEVKQPSEIELLTQQSLVIAEQLKTAKEEHIKWEAKESEARKMRDDNTAKITNYINSGIKTSTVTKLNVDEGNQKVVNKTTTFDFESPVFTKPENQ